RAGAHRHDFHRRRARRNHRAAPSLRLMPDSSTAPAQLAVRPATPADVPAIVALVNSAYRGESSRAGWTTEADYLDGQRTDADEVSRLIAAPDSVILLCHADGELIGSVHLERQ